MRRISRAIGVLSLVSLVAATAVGDPPGGPSVRYVVSADATLSTLTVRVCFVGAPPARLGPGIRAADRALIEAQTDAGEALPTRDGSIVLAGVGADECIRYRVDVDTALRASRFSGRYGIDFVTSQGSWLWRDRGRLPTGGASIRFELPDGLLVATPWPVDGRWQHLGPSAFRRPGFVAFGRRAPQIIERQHVRVRMVRLGDGWNVDDAELVRWLEEAIDGISTVQGRFPVDDLLVVLAPASGDGMGFAMVRRGGGHSAAFTIGRDASFESLRRNWVTWHELSHLHLPALPQRDAWLYEGLATYYQEVLPARLGIQTQETAWAELLDGFSRGTRSRANGTLSEASENLFSSGAFQRVYWSGTVFGLEADVALRGRGGSLDTAIARAARRWRGDLRLWSSAEVCAAWDAPLDARVLRPLRDSYAVRTGFPGTAQLLGRLGVTSTGEGVELRDAELSAVRDAIMSH